MAGGLGNLNIELSADTVRFMSDMGKAAHAVDTSIRKMQGAFSTLTRAAGGLGLVFTAGAMVAGIKNVINQADELGKLSQKVGVTVEALSGLKYAAELSDVSMEGLTTGLKKLATNMFEAGAGGEEALRLFKGLNIEFQSAPGKLLPTDEVLLKIADKFRQMEDGAGKSALAVKLFGRNGLELIPFLNQGREGIARLKDELEKLGGVMSGEMAKKAEEFNDNLKSISIAAKALTIEVGNSALPALTRITDAMRLAAAEAGILEALLVGVGGAMVEFSSKSDAARLRDLQGKIRQMQTQMYAGNPANPALQRQLDAMTSEANMLAKAMDPGERFGGYTGKPPKFQPDASAFMGKGPKGHDFVTQQWGWWSEEQKKIDAEAAQATDDFNRRMRARERLENVFDDEQKRITELFQNMGRGFSEEDLFGLDIEGRTTDELEEQLKALPQIIDQEKERAENAMRLAAGFDEQGRVIDKLKDDSKQWGLIFNSALEDAVINGKKLSEVLKAVGQDIARMVLRKTVTEPLGNAVGGIIGKAVKGIFEGGGGGGVSEADMAFAEGTDYVPRTGLALVHQGEAVIPASENMAGGRGSVNITLNVGSLDPRTAAHVIMENMPKIAGALAKAAHLRGKPSPV